MSTLVQTRKARPADEWVAERIFRPLAQRLVDPLARLGVRPTSLVLVHTGLGLLAAGLIGRGQGYAASRLAPALLIQLKTLLDNLDGQLARATGQTSEVGRYLDSEMDVVVNAALLYAVLGVRRGAAANVLLSLILTVDFLWEREYRQARGETFRDATAQATDSARLLAALKGVYAIYFGSQERLLGGLFGWRLRRVLEGRVLEGRVLEGRVTGGRGAERVLSSADLQTWTPLLLTKVASNLGLSTQMLALGACLLLGRPRLYAASLPVQAGALLILQLWRERRLARFLSCDTPPRRRLR
ncbi:CDP-alcohol phosphatidyltransferase family protein [Deinococcus sp.]|uniref:CDP-alcohol phosphatidyltransferase family protein n=1 Tax=Deinococcus sp. TaxID=47478 RepID=UPI003CC62763